MNIGQLAQLITTGKAAATCEACGNAFTCGATLKGCWCADIKLNDQSRAELESGYRNCLCRDCLERVAAAEVDHEDHKEEL